MARHRFTPTERETFIISAVVEWRNGRHWHAGEIVAPGIESDPHSGVRGAQRVWVRNTARTGTGVPRGERLIMSPTSIRAKV